MYPFRIGILSFNSDENIASDFEIVSISLDLVQVRPWIVFHWLNHFHVMSMNGVEFPGWSDNRSQTKNGLIIESFQLRIWTAKTNDFCWSRQSESFIMSCSDGTNSDPGSDCSSRPWLPLYRSYRTCGKHGNYVNMQIAPNLIEMLTEAKQIIPAKLRDFEKVQDLEPNRTVRPISF